MDINELRMLAEDLYVNGYNRYSSAMSKAADELECLRAKIAEIERQEPVFWWRPCSDGTYEGPLHNNSIERVRKLSGAWSPLYALPGAQTQGEGK